MYICLLLCLERFDIILFTKSNEALTEWVRREKRARTLFAYVVSPHKMHKWQTAHSTVVSCESSAGCRLPFCPIDNPKIYYRSALTKHIHQNIVYTHASIPKFFWVWTRLTSNACILSKSFHRAVLYKHAMAAAFFASNGNAAGTAWLRFKWNLSWEWFTGETEDKRTAKVTLRWWRQTKTKVQTERFRLDINENLENFLFTANYETPTFFSLSRHE